MIGYLVVNLENPYRICSFESFEEIPGIINSGNSFRLPGHVLVKIDLGGRGRFYYYHPETNPSDTGDFDIVIRPESDRGKFKWFSSKGKKITIIDLETDFRYLWPTGAESFIQIFTMVNIHIQLSLSGIHVYHVFINSL